MSVYLDRSIDYGDVLKIGDKIRSWDFPVREGIEDRWIEGTVTQISMSLATIEVSKDSVNWGEDYNRCGELVRVPLFYGLDWENRIEVLV